MVLSLIMLILTTLINGAHTDTRSGHIDAFEHNRRVNRLVKFDVVAPAVFFVVSLMFGQVILPILCIPFLVTTVVLYKQDRLFFTPSNLSNRLRFDEKYSVVKVLMYSGVFVYVVIRGAIQLGFCLADLS